MEVLVKDSKGELITIVIRDDDTFRELNRRMEKEHGLQMDFTNMHHNDKIDLDQNILACMTENNELETAGTEDDLEVSQIEENSASPLPEEEEALEYSDGMQIGTTIDDALTYDEVVEIPEGYQLVTFASAFQHQLQEQMGVDCKEESIIVEAEGSETELPAHSENYEILYPQQKGETLTKVILEISNDVASPLCRLCACKSDEMVYIFGTAESEGNIVEKIDICLPITVRMTDTFPKQVCRACLTKLELCHEFHKTVKNAEKLFLEISGPMSCKSKLMEENPRPYQQSCKDIPIVLHSIPQESDENIENIHAAHPGGPENEIANCKVEEKWPSKKTKKNPIQEELREKSIVSSVIKTENLSAATVSQTKTLSSKDGNPSEAPMNPLKNYKTQSTKKTPGIEIQKSTVKTEASFSDQEDDPPDIDSSNVGFEEKSTFLKTVEYRMIKCRICGESFQTAKKCHIHSSVHAKEDYYPCGLCDKVFSTEEDCNEHSIEHTEGRKSERRAASYECDECGKRFVTEARLKFHISFHATDARPRYCEKCNKCMISESSLYQHMVTVHRQYKGFCCDLCGKQFRAQTQLDTHQRKHKDERTFECTICKKRFYSNDILRRHKKLHLANKSYQCDQCGKRFDRNNNLTNHLLRHQAEAGQSMLCRICTACKEVFVSMENADAHTANCKLLTEGSDGNVEARSLNAMYKCEFCDKCYTEGKVLKSHKQCHGGPQPYVCTICDIPYETYNQVTAHKSAHRKSREISAQDDVVIPKYFLCENCDKPFLRYTSMNIHRKSCANGKTSTCRYCGSIFSNGRDLAKHKRGDNNGESWSCEECNFVFGSVCALEIHKEIHSGTGRKVAACSFCGKDFNQSEMLKLVLQTEEGQQIEVSVGPDDTFANLQSQYDSPENPGLPELLKHLITNGTDVDDDTKVFDFVTNSSSTEWLMEETLEDISGLDSVDVLQAVIVQTPVKECCVKGCFNTEMTTPNKMFFSLPNDQERLSTWLIGIGRQELLETVLQPDSEKYFVCGDHFTSNQFLKGTNKALKRRACPSLSPSTTVVQTVSTSILKPTVVNVKTEIRDEPSSKLKAEEETSFEDPEEIDNDMLEFLDTMEELAHPGVLCRLCGEHTINPIYLYTDKDNDTEYSLADKINLCLPITVNAKDPLPKQLCPGCHEKLNTCHKLAMTCLRTEDQLKALLQMKKFHVEDEQTAQCPLCVHGNMQAVIKSGIYRKDKVENDPTTLKNSSARTRQVTLSKNAVVRTEQWVPVEMQDSQSLEGAVSEKKLEKLSEADDIPTSPLPPLPRGVLSCSICRRIEPDLYALKFHASSHSGLPCTICENVTFNTANEQTIHFMRHGIDKEWCEYCAADFTNIAEAAEHVKTCKPEFWDVQCDRCGEKFPDVENEDGHACPVPEEDEGLECDQCGKKFYREANLNAHMKIHQKRDPALYRCSFCSKQFARKGSLHKHLSAVHDNVGCTVQPKCYKCNKCYEAFATAVSAETHITEKHFSQLIIADMNYINDQLTAEELSVSRVYICEYCERCYTNPSSLHEHRQSEHTANSDYRCGVCDNSFESFKLLVNHKTLHGRTNQLEDLGIKQYYVCKYCNKTFLHYGTLIVHEGLHQPPDPYLCRLCNISFPTYEEVAVHRRTVHPYQSSLHEMPNNLYHCQYCEKSFTHEVALIKHIRMHTGERPYKCSVCGKAFSQSSGLYTHLKVHSNLRPYTCPECPRTFKIKGDRDNHVKKHSGNRPYKCDFCEKAFMTQHVYSQHRKIHTNERPYKCDICGEAFRRSHVLTVHMRRHTGEKPHTCDVCPKAYRQRGDLLKHKRIQHGIGARHSHHILGIPNHVLKSNLLSADSTSVLLPI